MANYSVVFATTEASPLDDYEYTDSTEAEGTDAQEAGVELPLGIWTFAPFLIFELVAVVTCNLILMALVIKARKVNNNTNIYLFSLSLSSLLESINLFTLVITIFARRWILGRELCYVNDFIFRIGVFPIFPINALVSRDRFKAIKDPLNYWKVSTKKTYMLNVLVWTMSILVSIISLIWYAVRTPLPNTQLLGVECYFALHLIEADFAVSLVEILVISVFNGLWLISLSAYTMWHYVLVLKELHKLAKLRSQFCVFSDSNILKVNKQDKPLHCTAEERAAKSLALMFLFEFFCSFTSLIILCVLSLMSLVSNGNEANSSRSAAIVLLLSIYFLPGINPLILAVSNKRFRKRIKGLLKCELTPEDEGTYDYYRHLDETDLNIQLGQLQSVQEATTDGGSTKRRRSLFVNKRKNSQVSGKVKSTSSNTQKKEDAKEEEVKAMIVMKRNPSVTSIAAVDVRIRESISTSVAGDSEGVSDTLYAWKDGI